MIFDQALRSLERCPGLDYWDSHEFAKLLGKASLFEVEPNCERELLDDELSDPDFIRDRLFLPFPFVAIDDGQSCGLVFRVQGDGTPGLPSDFDGYAVIELVPFEVSSRSGMLDSRPSDRHKPSESWMRDSITVAVTTIDRMTHDPKKRQHHVEGTLHTIFVAGESGALWNRFPAKEHAEKQEAVGDGGFLGPPLAEFDVRQALQNATAILEQVMWINSPSRFIMERAPARKRKPGKKRKHKYNRSTERPVYTVLKPGEIRRAMKLPEPQGTHASPRPHERRAHLRTLRAERYGENRGKTIRVKSSWVGPTESEHGGHRYRVITEK